MEKITSKQIRQMWLDFFASKGHEVVASKSLIPVNDPSLLWINSGVATLKDYFTGKKIPQNPRITNSQKSIRTNDIENVGVTARHHTLFEMLGNFSVGEYFKPEALEFAYELLFKVFKFDKQKIYFTYFEEDQVTYDKWISLGIDPSHMIKGSRDTNFWDVGQGPCGPCTEIFYDRGEKYDPEHVGLKLLKEDLENDRYIEIWNIVFSQFNNDGNNNYEEMKQKNIDTGAGLERIVSIFQDAPTNFDTDLFQPIIKEVERMTGSKYDINNYFTREKIQWDINKNFKIIADHMRAVSLAIEDGAKPSNTQRGYIIRRLIRRAYRSGLLLGMKDEAFLYRLVPTVAEVMSVFPINIEKVSEAIKKEELAFAKTINQGQELLNKELQNAKEEFDFAIAFKLFETYGFPIELTQEILEEKGIKLDISKFEEFKEMHAEASRGKKINGMDSQIQIIQAITSTVSEFVGYDALETNSKVIFKGSENGKHFVLLDKTPFYATSGGQNSDFGTIDEIQVLDVFKDKFGNSWHVTEEEITNDNVVASVDTSIRLAKERNHSATHLMGAALRQVFGNQVAQLGSDNNEKRLRFDFPLEQRPTKEQLLKIEQIVNSFIKESHERTYTITSVENGKKMGAIALEGEEYVNPARVVSFGVSIEFCGGTHVKNTLDIEAFKITKFESKGSGVFRIEAITSTKAVEAFVRAEVEKMTIELNKVIDKNKAIDSKYSFAIPTRLEDFDNAIEQAKEDNKKLSKTSQTISVSTDVEFTNYKGMKAHINLAFGNAGALKNAAITLREAHQDALIILGVQSNDKTTLAVASKIYNAKKVFDEIAIKHSGRGGGVNEFAMGSMNKVEEL